MTEKIGDSVFECFEIFVSELGLCKAAVHFKSANGSNDNNCARGESSHTAFDVEELFCAEVGSEASFGNSVVAELHSHSGSDYRVTSMSNISERSAVNECRSSFECLNEIRL